MMRYRNINLVQARRVLAILVEECGHRVHDPRDATRLIESIITPQPDGGYVCNEYRFCGALGFGGKFCNNGNRDNTPYVDCYREDETPARLQMIEAANKRLAELFEGMP